MNPTPDIYARKALEQLHRLLGLTDRNPFSETFGCMHRDYWLFKTSDFPDAVRQFGMHALALAWRYEMPGSCFYQQPKMLAWTIGALDYWTKIQHNDGSFDEFYPNERGWVGPTAFTTFTACETYKIIAEHLDTAQQQRAMDAIAKAAHFIAAGEAEEDHLANHHAMACLALRKAHDLLDEPKLDAAFDQRLEIFTNQYHRPEEGWSREYDGIDPGYLSATVSFFAKAWQSKPDPRLLEIIEQSVNTCAYFVYPNGFYAGSAGSRNTLHFYCHGFEVVGSRIPLAAAVAMKMRQALAQDKLVWPGLQADRYVHYRVPECMLAYIDAAQVNEPITPVPYQREPFVHQLTEARIDIRKRSAGYSVCNLAKGGVTKIFDPDGKLQISDCGWVGRLTDGKLVSTQWIDPTYQIEMTDTRWSVKGNFQAVPANKLFTPLKNVIFRLIMICLGFNALLAARIKGQIRRILILGKKPVPITFSRSAEFTDTQLTLTDHIQIQQGLRFQSLIFGDEFFLRYVPQSRYFQSQELDVTGYTFNPSELDKLNQAGQLTVVTTITPNSVTRQLQWPD